MNSEKILTELPGFCTLYIDVYTINIDLLDYYRMCHVMLLIKEVQKYE
ncbi:hypothetical protein SCACP_27140 [Sporomusa carbonis]